jgi:hypothetical protein
MKIFILFVFSFFGLINSSFSGLLDEELHEVKGGLSVVKDTHKNTRSQLGGGYPTIGTMVHSYHHEPVATPFSAKVPEETVQRPQSLVRQFNAIKGYKISYAFIVQGIEKKPSSGDQYKDTPFCLKPQYCLFPKAERSAKSSK